MNFLFGALKFELIEFEIVTSAMFAAFKSVILSDLAMEVSLKFFKRFRVEEVASGESSVRSNGNNANVNVRIVFVHVAMAIHDIFFSVAMLEEMESVFEILFASVFVELEHKISRGTDNKIFKPDGVSARFAFQLKLFDTLVNVAD